GFATNASTGSGDGVGIIAAENQLIVPQGFTGGALSATMTFDNTTLEDLRLVPGTSFLWMWSITSEAPDDSFGVTLGTPVSTTPLPTALPLFATGIGGLGLFGWRRKRQAQAAA